MCETVTGVYILFLKDHLKPWWMWYLYVEREWGVNGKIISRTHASVGWNMQVEVTEIGKSEGIHT